MKPTISNSTLAFIVEFGPFTKQVILNRDLGKVYVVRDRLGFDHVQSEDEETIVAVVEALNAIQYVR